MGFLPARHHHTIRPGARARLGGPQLNLSVSRALALPHVTRRLSAVKWFWIAYALFSAATVAYSVRALVRSATSVYPRQHSSGVLGGAGSLFLALSFLVPWSAARWGCLVAALGLLVVDAALWRKRLAAHRRPTNR
jgi:hypothetical protein